MKLSPSVLSADFARLLDAVRAVEPWVDRLHWDVMDAHFVPNLTFGPPVVNSLRRHLEIPFDVHLMIDHPADYVERFELRSDDSIIFHIEADDAPRAVFGAIGRVPARAGVTLRPGTPLESLAPLLDDVSLILMMTVEPGFGGQRILPSSADRVRAVRALVGPRPIEIAVDGGIDVHNIRAIAHAGADIVVAGSAIFGQSDPVAAAKALRAAAR